MFAFFEVRRSPTNSMRSSEDMFTVWIRLVHACFVFCCAFHRRRLPLDFSSCEFCYSKRLIIREYVSSDQKERVVDNERSVRFERISEMSGFILAAGRSHRDMHEHHQARLAGLLAFF
jgi:hypothetical protein